MEKNYKILLPNSKSKNIENIFNNFEKVKNKNKYNNLNFNTNKIYLDLIKLINEKNQTELKKIFDLKNEKKLEEELKQIKNFYKNKTNYTINKFSGVMFKYINYENMKNNQKNNFNKNVIFIDALFGLLNPLDKIPNYKLEFTTKFSYNLSKYWNQILESFFTNLNDIIIIDILPQSHRKVLSKNLFKNKNYFSINFFENNKNVGHKSKMLKGELINYLCSFEKICKNDLLNFKNKEGFKFSKKLSEENKINFCK